MKRQQLWSIGVVSAVLAVTGCGGSESSSATTPAPATTEAPTPTTATPEPTTPPTTQAPATTAPEPTTPPTTAAPEPTTPPTTEAPEPTVPPTTAALDPDVDPEVAADIELARTALLTLDDFPPGWYETPNDPEDDLSDNEKFDAMIDECLGDAAFDDDFLDERKVESGDFGTDEYLAEADQDVILAPTEADAIAAITAVGNEAAPDCFLLATQTMFDEILADPDQTDFPPGTSIGTVEVDFLDYGLAPDEGVVLFVYIPAEFGGEQVDLFLENWYMRSGRALSQMTFTGTNGTFPQEGIDELTGTVYELLAQIG